MKVETETKPYDTINVTPMLDLAYVLLVIFIIMTTASVQGLKINLPKPSNKPSQVQKEVRIVQIMPDGALLLNGSPVTLTGIGGPPTHTATVSPNPLAFGNWATGTTSNARTLTVTICSGAGVCGAGGCVSTGAGSGAGSG